MALWVLPSVRTYQKNGQIKSGTYVHSDSMQITHYIFFRLAVGSSMTISLFFGKEEIQMQKAQYGILRFAKYKGPEISNIEAHNERKKEKYASNPDIDNSRKNMNYHLIEPSGKYRAESNRLIEEYGCRTRKDSVRVVEALITATPEFFKGKKKLTWWQDEFWKHMVEKYPDLERGEAASMTGREHIPPRLFKEAAHLTRQAKQITDLLENTNFFNAGKNTDKAVELLQKFFPAMENFQTQVRKYDKTISSLKSDNVSLKRQTQDLSRQIKEATSSSIRKKMDDARLRADYENLQNLMNRIPPEILELAKRGQLTHSDRER